MGLAPHPPLPPRRMVVTRSSAEGRVARLRDGGPRFDELVLAERVKLLHARAAVAQATVVINASIVTAVFWRIAPRAPSLAWLLSLAALAAARLVAMRAYRARLRAPAEAAFWARLFTLGAFLSGAGWGAAALLFVLPGSPAHQSFVAFVLGGMAAGAA